MSFTEALPPESMLVDDVQNVTTAETVYLRAFLKMNIVVSSLRQLTVQTTALPGVPGRVHDVDRHAIGQKAT